MRAYDALVIGAGPAGSTAAALLARAGWSVALAEKSTFPRPKVCGGFVAATNSGLMDELGVATAFEDAAGPEVRSVGFFSGPSRLTAPMPRAAAPSRPYGRAMRREKLDTLMLERAVHFGARLYQPCSIVRTQTHGESFRCAAAGTVELRARLVVAAHGSWLTGPLATQPRHGASRAKDLIGFKAHFRGAALAADAMPLLAFPGGYGGLVNADEGCTTLSFCVRRDVITACRTRHRRAGAGDALLAHIMESCDGVREALQGATREGPWLAAGPIRPGVRRFCVDGVHVTGNAAGEAHPAIAEGIGMAMQSAALLSRALVEGEDEAVERYAERWHERFRLRVAASSVFAQIAMRPKASALAGRLLGYAPGVLTLCARLSGKDYAAPAAAEAAGRRS